MDDLEALFHIFGENAIYIDEKFFEQLERELPKTDPETDEGSIEYVT